MENVLSNGRTFFRMRRADKANRTGRHPLCRNLYFYRHSPGVFDRTSLDRQPIKKARFRACSIKEITWSKFIPFRLASLGRVPCFLLSFGHLSGLPGGLHQPSIRGPLLAGALRGHLRLRFVFVFRDPWPQIHVDFSGSFALLGFCFVP